MELYCAIMMTALVFKHDACLSVIGSRIITRRCTTQACSSFMGVCLSFLFLVDVRFFCQSDCIHTLRWDCIYCSLLKYAVSACICSSECFNVSSISLVLFYCMFCSEEKSRHKGIKNIQHCDGVLCDGVLCLAKLACKMQSKYCPCA
jgi:hypothetical protein